MRSEPSRGVCYDADPPPSHTDPPPTQVALGMLGSLLMHHRNDTDIIITDFSVNDAYEIGPRPVSTPFMLRSGNGENGRKNAVFSDTKDRSDAKQKYEEAAAVAESLINGRSLVLLFVPVVKFTKH